MYYRKDRNYYFWNPEGFVDTVYVQLVAENGIVFSWKDKLYVATNKVASKRIFATAEEVPEYRARRSWHKQQESAKPDMRTEEQKKEEANRPKGDDRSLPDGTIRHSTTYGSVYTSPEYMALGGD